MKPLVTALVDTFNHERYIEQALVSVLEQGLSPEELEIVVVDDGSTDKAPSIIQKFLPRIKYLRKNNGGQASAYNRAFPEVHGQMVAFLDGDDWWAKGKLTAVMNAFEKDPEATAVGHGYYEVNEATKEVRAYVPQQTKFLHLGTPEAAREASLAWPFLLPSALSVRRKVLERVMPIPEVLVFCADAPIVVAAMALGVRVLPEPLFYYRHHSDNLYSIDPKNLTKLRRRHEITEMTFQLLEPLLIRLGVEPDSVAACIYPPWVELSRLGLRTLGGTRLQTFRTEMRSFRSEPNKPSISYHLFKYLVVGGATLLLPPRYFYKMRDWYGQHNLGHIREQFARSR